MLPRTGGIHSPSAPARCARKPVSVLLHWAFLLGSCPEEDPRPIRRTGSEEIGLQAYDCNAGNLEQARMMAESQPQMAGGTVKSRDERHLFPMLGATTIVLLIAACKLVVHLYAGHRYGYLGDELYFLACSRHLAWGYVDQPPLIAMIAWAVRNTLGQSLLAIRFLPARAGAVEVVLTALIARELGGRRFAPVRSAISTLTAPVMLVAH